MFLLNKIMITIYVMKIKIPTHKMKLNVKMNQLEFQPQLNVEITKTTKQLVNQGSESKSQKICNLNYLNQLMPINIIFRLRKMMHMKTSNHQISRIICVIKI